MCQGNCRAIVRIEALGFNHGLTDDAVASRARMLLRMSICAAWSRIRGREQPDRPIGEHSVHVEENDFDFFGPIDRHGSAFDLVFALLGLIFLSDLLLFSPCLRVSVVDLLWPKAKSQ